MVLMEQQKYFTRKKSKNLRNPAEALAAKKAEYNKLFCNPFNAARYGYIDDVIEPRNTRFRVIRALEQLRTAKASQSF